jgi:hypothetical protein
MDDIVLRPGSTTPPRHWRPGIRCYECDQSAENDANIVDNYLFGGAVTCPLCHANLDSWRVAVLMVNRNFARLEPFVLLGAQFTVFQTRVVRDRGTQFDLYAEGLPSNALILNVNIGGEGMFCGEAGGSDRILRATGGLLNIHAYHMTHSPEPRANEGHANIFVTWVPNSPDDAAWTNLVTAFSHYVGGSYEASLIPANVAVEAKLFQFLERHLSRVASTETVEQFLTMHATYSHQLNVLLPLVVSHLGAKPLNRDLRGKLNRLNKLRNDVAHRGRCTPSPSKDECAELVTASLIAFRYLGYLNTLGASSTESST